MLTFAVVFRASVSLDASAMTLSTKSEAAWTASASEFRRPTATPRPMFFEQYCERVRAASAVALIGASSSDPLFARQHVIVVIGS